MYNFRSTILIYIEQKFICRNKMQHYCTKEDYDEYLSLSLTLVYSLSRAAAHSTIIILPRALSLHGAIIFFYCTYRTPLYFIYILVCLSSSLHDRYTDTHMHKHHQNTVTSLSLLPKLERKLIFHFVAFSAGLVLLAQELQAAGAPDIAAPGVRGGGYPPGFLLSR